MRLIQPDVYRRGSRFEYDPSKSIGGTRPGKEARVRRASEREGTGCTDAGVRSRSRDRLGSGSEIGRAASSRRRYPPLLARGQVLYPDRASGISLSAGFARCPGGARIHDRTSPQLNRCAEFCRSIPSRAKCVITRFYR